MNNVSALLRYNGLQTCAALIARLMKKLISLLVVYGSVLPTVGFAEHKESR